MKPTEGMRGAVVMTADDTLFATFFDPFSLGERPMTGSRRFALAAAFAALVVAFAPQQAAAQTISTAAAAELATVMGLTLLRGRTEAGIRRSVQVVHVGL